MVKKHIFRMHTWRRQETCGRGLHFRIFLTCRDSLVWAGPWSGRVLACWASGAVLSRGRAGRESAARKAADQAANEATKKKQSAFPEGCRSVSGRRGCGIAAVGRHAAAMLEAGLCSYSRSVSGRRGCGIALEVGGVSQVSPDAQPGHRFVSFVRAGEARRGEAA